MAENTVLRQVKGPVVTLTISRPSALNALNSEILQALTDELTRIEEQFRAENFTQRVVILRGAGDKAFVAGADIREMEQASDAEIEDFIRLGQRAMDKISLLPLPVIAAVDGFALGGGFELALACDVLVATERSRVGLPEVGLGLIPGFGGTQRLSMRAGVGVAKRLILTGEMLTSRDASDLGIIDIVVPDTDLEKRVAELVVLLLQRGPIAMASAKSCIEEHFRQDREIGLREERESFCRLVQGSEAREGLRAFIEKRKAAFVVEPVQGKK